jgi:hypothetical protein
MTVRTLTSYQLIELSGYFALTEVLKLGRVDETGNIIIEYVALHSKNRAIQTKSIPPQQEAKETENTEYEVLTPKQLTDGTK